MILAALAPLLSALAAAALAPPTLPPREIDHAIAMGRFDQARLMLAAAVEAGASGAAIERPLASLAFATGRDAEALARIEALLAASPNDELLLEQATIAATRCGLIARATQYAIRAVAQPRASWRAWNAKGVLADAARDWIEADRAYARAAALAPDRADVSNNRGWSHLLRGEWEAAHDALARAAALDPHSTRIANNLDLAELGLAGDLPTQRDGETLADYAARLNDAGIAAGLRGDPRRARAAFAQAIVASGHWYTRASRNLAAVEGVR